MRVSLVIDGDSKEAVQAATDARQAVTELGKAAGDTSKGLEDGFKKATGAAGNLKGSTEAAGGANDNLMGSVSGLAGKFGELVGKVKGSGDALAQATGQAGGFAKGVADLVRSGAGVGLLTGGIGLAVSAATTFYGIWSSAQAAAAEARLQEQARLVDLVRGAYTNATNAAGDFLTQSKEVTKFQLEQSIAGLKDDRSKATKTATGSYTTDYATAGLSQINNPFSDGSETRSIEQFRGAVEDLERALQSGDPNIRQYQDRIVAIANAARATNPELAATAKRILDQAKPAAELSSKIDTAEAALAKLNGTATPTQEKMLGLSKSTGDAGNRFESLAKSMDRQAASAEAEAAATGRSAGEIAKMRIEAVLTEAAQQAGGGAAEKYADRIKQIGDRAGEAAQKLALARVQSDAAFGRQTLGLSADDAQIAEQLRGAYGNDVTTALNSGAAEALKFNQNMQQLKNTTLDVSKGAFSDLRTQIQQGATAMEALGTAGVNALNRIADKIVSSQLDSLVSKLFGSATGGGTSWLSSLFGGSSGSSGATDTITVGSQTFPKFAAGGTLQSGWGVVGEEGAELIKVHGGGVTVFPHHVSKPYLPGFAEGGSLDSLGNIARLPGAAPSAADNAAAASAASASAPQGVAVSVGVSVDDQGSLKAYVKKVAQQSSAGAVSAFAKSPQFVDHVANASNTGRALRKLR
jgi:hypothetical protein